MIASLTAFDHDDMITKEGVSGFTNNNKVYRISRSFTYP